MHTREKAYLAADQEGLQDARCLSTWARAIWSVLSPAKLPLLNLHPRQPLFRPSLLRPRHQHFTFPQSPNCCLTMILFQEARHASVQQ